jgi:Zn-finger nucleic acid-binding protein
VVEEEKVACCESCRGLLTTRSSFQVILERRRARAPVTRTDPKPIDPRELERSVSCPVCRRRMETHPYYGGGNVVIDSCDACQFVWLDAGELTRLGDWAPHKRPRDPLPTPAVEPVPQPLAGSHPLYRERAAAVELLAHVLFGSW